jgi:Nitrile hydratase, alpha chain
MAQRHPPGNLELSSRVLTDDDFRTALLKDPAATLEREYGVKVPKGVKLRVLEETDEEIHLIIPGRPNRTESAPGRGPTAITEKRPESTTCCTCGAWTAQTLKSFQKDCGCV